MSGSLPTWLERWLGIEAPGRGEGTHWSLEHAWSWPAWVTLLVGLGCAALVVICYAREGSAASRRSRTVLVLIRLVTLLLVGLMLAELMLSLRRTGLPTVAVLVDDSASMSIVDRWDDARLAEAIRGRLRGAGFSENTRWNQARALLLGPPSHLLAGIDRRYRLKLYLVSATARPPSGGLAELGQTLRQVEPTGESTRLGEAVRSVLADLRGTPPAALVVLTDGVTTDGESLADAARLARRRGVPLFPVGLGSDQPVRDLELSDLLVDDVVFVDDVVNFEFKLSGTGLAGRSVEVTLREKDQPTVLARMTAVVAPHGQPQKLFLPYRPTKVGEFEYVVEVEHLPDEVQEANNRQQRLVSVRREHVRVLLAQAYPNHEFKYLKQMLQRDSTIELKTVLQDADPEYASLDQTALPVFPVRREELFEFDVLILGDLNPTFLSSTVLSHVAAFVEEKGGGVALIAGPNYLPLAFRNTPLAPLLPVDLGSVELPAAGEAISEGFVPQPTELGWSSPQMQLGDTRSETEAIWKSLPPMFWLARMPHLKPAARVLAEHPSERSSDGRPLPVVCVQYFGKGKVLLHAVDETWRWRYRVGDLYFARYWVQAVRYLSRAKLLGKDRAAELTADRRAYRRGELVRLRARFVDERQAPTEDDGVSIMLQRPGQPNQRIALRRNAANRGVFEGAVSGLLDGAYHAWIATPSLAGQAPATDFMVSAPPGEFERVELDAGELSRAAEVSLGRAYRFASADRLLGDLPPGRQVPIEPLQPWVLWNQWWALLAVLCLLVTEWILRKRQGML